MSGDTGAATTVGRALLHRLDEDFVAWPWRLEPDCLAPGIPPRPMSPSGLRRWLLAGSTDYPTRDRTWSRIVVRSRPPDPEATAFRLLAVGLAGYGLRNYARRIHVRSSQDLPDLHADLVTGFLVRLATVDPEGRNVAGRLIDSAIGYAARRYRPARPIPVDLLQASHARPGADVGDVRDLPDGGGGGRDERETLGRTLRRAVERAALDGTPVPAGDVDLIAATRLDGQSVSEVAARLGLGVDAAYKRRRRAEQRLAVVLRYVP